MAYARVRACVCACVRTFVHGTQGDIVDCAMAVYNEALVQGLAPLRAGEVVRCLAKRTIDSHAKRTIDPAVAGYGLWAYGPRRIPYGLAAHGSWPVMFLCPATCGL